MNKDQGMDVFEKAPVGRAVLQNVLPAMAAMLMVLVYNLADTFFIGQTRDAYRWRRCPWPRRCSCCLWRWVPSLAWAAIATVIGNVVGAGYYIVYFCRGGSALSIRLQDFTVGDKVASGVLAIGVPAALGSFLMSVSSILMNGQMARYGDMAVAGVGVAMKVTMMTGMLCIGLGQGVQPLLGYCVGAKNWTRYRQALRFSLALALGLSAVLTGLCYVFVRPIVRAFLTDPAAFDYGVSFARILLSTSILFGVFYVLVNALQACRAATESLIVNISRQGLVYLHAMFLLGAAFHEQGLIWAQPVADVLSLLLAAALYMRKSRKMMD